MEENKEMKVNEQEIVTEGTERTRDCRCFVPKTDIYEFEENIIIVLDMPGINENAIDITLEKNILKVKGLVQLEDYDNHSLVFSEYEPGDFERSFRISDEIDTENIEATSKDGVLHLVLSRSPKARTKKIAVKVG